MLPRMIARLLAAALLGLVVFAAPARAQTAGERAAVVVELFTSQGCAQCPRANRLLGQFTREDGVLALTFSVDMWDYLGWADTFAQPEFDDRQRAYARALRSRGRVTPQLVLNGARQLNAYDWDEARAEFDRARTQTAMLSANDLSITRLRNNRVRVTLGSNAAAGHAGAEVWLVAFDDRALSVTVTGGLNRDRNVMHYNIVREITRLGEWDGRPAYYERSRCTPECAVIVQRANGGPILGAAYTRN
jgi:hypothetical protein